MLFVRAFLLLPSRDAPLSHLTFPLPVYLPVGQKGVCRSVLLGAFRHNRDVVVGVHSETSPCFLGYFFIAYFLPKSPDFGSLISEPEWLEESWSSRNLLVWFTLKLKNRFKLKKKKSNTKLKTKCSCKGPKEQQLGGNFPERHETASNGRGDRRASQRCHRLPSAAWAHPAPPHSAPPSVAWLPN